MLRMSQGRLAFSLLVGVLCGTVVFAQDVDPHWRSDAQLTDVQFVDAQTGWAVGDRGTIWHTEDGGRHWELQASQVDCRLNTACFLDGKTGWVAGGYTHPYTHVTSGVVLRTRDGGQHWSCDRNSLLPAVRSMQFFDPAHGVAVGSASSMFPAGVFTTDDGGRSWTSLPPGGEQSWLAAVFADPNTGVLVGRQGAVAAVRRRAIELSQSSFGLRSIHRVKPDGRGNLWLAGDGGLVMQSDDGGLSWLTPKTELARELRQQFDFHALEVRGDQIWLAGSPGACVLHSPDAGVSWQKQTTGQTVPIRALTFVDERHGWAVGDLGVILTTDDGGQSWQAQRRGGERAALLGIFSQPQDVPLELFAKLAGDDGYLAAIELLHREDLETPTAQSFEVPDRIHEALIRAGASATQTSWRFPSRQSGLKLSTEKLIDSWNRASDGRALDRLDEHLVRQLRVWRPSIVVGSLAAADGDIGRMQLVHQLLLRAIERAADPSVYPEQLHHAGLSAWQTSKLFAALPSGELGTVSIATAQTTRSGRTVADLASPARGMVDGSYTPSPAEVGFRLVIDRLPQDVGRKDFFSGIALSPGGEARRKLREVPDQTVDAIRRSAQARRNLNAILAQAAEKRADDGRYLAEVTGLTRTMDPSHAAEVLLQLADRYHQHGQWQLAADTYDAIIERYPKHPAAGAALVWQVQYYASSEAAWRVSQRQQMVNVQRNTEQQFGSEILRPAPRDVQRASAVLSLDGEESDRPSRAAGYAKQLEQLSATLASEPTVRFPLAAAQRQRGYSRDAERFFLGFVRNRPQDAWWRCGQAEVAMLESRASGAANARQNLGAPNIPKPIYRCVRTSVRPRLDGKLNDPVWASAKPVDLRSALRDDADWPATVMLAHDDGFLYLAVTCRESAETRFTPSTRPRPRDGDLSNHDRVELYLDLDRDYVTAYRLAIDARGWTGESCWRDASWNPQWYVAAARSENPRTPAAWTAEAAIPLAELTRQLHPGERWALGIQRILPNTGFQSWTQPAAVEPHPEGFGVLVFE
jgi:photosystem II stability/assembly factor-like uncharacterized protein